MHFRLSEVKKMESLHGLFVFFPKRSEEKHSDMIYFLTKCHHNFSLAWEIPTIYSSSLVW